MKWQLWESNAILSVLEANVLGSLLPEFPSQTNKQKKNTPHDAGLSPFKYVD